MRKILSIAVLLSIMTPAFSEEVEIGNLWYSLLPDKEEAELVQNKNSIYYSGNIVIPESIEYEGVKYTVRRIGRVAFSGCEKLVSITIPNSVTLIDEFAFERCVKLKSLIIPNSVTSIRKDAFYGCSSLTSITIPNSVRIIGKSAFYGCSGLTSITIPSNVTSIGDFAFEECIGLTTIVVEEGNTKYDSRNNCNAIIETSSNTLIVGCKNTTIPNSVTSIGTSAFSGCTSLTTITIPNSVTSIGNYAFLKCTGLISVIVENERPITITNGTFGNRSETTLYVPNGTKSAYESSDYWNEFKEIVELDEEVETTISMSSNGIQTFSSNKGLDFTDVNGLKAFIASGFSPSTGELTMTRVFKVPADEGLIVKGEAGDYEIPFTTTDNYYANLLKGVTETTTIYPTEGDYTNYILANDETNGIGFYPLSTSGTIAAGKAYLQLPTAVSGARQVRLLFDDEEDVTGIRSIEKGEWRIENFFNLSGQRIARPTKGIYVKNGKKVLVK